MTTTATPSSSSLSPAAWQGITVAALLFVITGASAAGDAWSLAQDASRLYFMSVKAGDIAESHTFGELDGSISPSGDAELTIDLTTVDTAIDIRNERMRNELFHTDQHPVATIRTHVDMDAVAALGVGDSMTATYPTDLSLSGTDTRLDAELQVTRISRTQVQVITAAPIVLNAATLGLADGVEKLRTLAGLPAISLSVPVDFSLTFITDDKVAAK